MKKIIALALVFALVLILTTCTATPSESEPEYNPFKDRFTEYHAGDDADVIVDNMTGVCYLWKNQYQEGGLCVMLDADGSPLIYKED